MCICPCAALSVCFAQFVFDFDAVKALLGDDRSFALEILVRSTCHRFRFPLVHLSVPRLTNDFLR